MSGGKLIKGKFVRVIHLSGHKLTAPAWGEIVWETVYASKDDCDVDWFQWHPEDSQIIEMDCVDSGDTYRVYSLETLPNKVAAAYAAWRLAQ